MYRHDNKQEQSVPDNRRRARAAADRRQRPAGVGKEGQPRTDARI